MKHIVSGGVAALAMTAFAFGASAESIVLGAAVSQSGKYSTNGEHTMNGYNMAADMINAAGGIDVGGTMYTIEIKYYDDESTPARGAELAERLISQDGVKFLLGPYSSGLTKAIAPVTEKHGVPMVEANGASRSLFTNGYEYLFAVLSTSEQYLASSITLAAEKAVADGRDPATLKIAMAFENDPFSQDIRAGVMADAATYGMQIIIDDKLPKDLSDMTPTLTKVRALQPDLLVVSGHSKGAVTAIRQINEQNIYVPMLAMTHCDSADIIGKFGDGAENTLCASQWAPTLTYQDDLMGSAADFASNFETRFGYAPPYQAAESAAAVMVFADAFTRAGSTDQAAVRDALSATDMQTFYGNVKFDDTGKNTAKPMVLFQVQGGALKVVGPTQWAESEIVHPRPAN
ncbi:MAG: amino acid ABC transporter substrate-binding protein [Paracoccaceae bacterium]